MRKKISIVIIVVSMAVILLAIQMNWNAKQVINENKTSLFYGAQIQQMHYPQYLLTVEGDAEEQQRIYSKYVTKAFVSGAVDELPFEFFHFNSGFDNEKHYNTKDPLGWLSDLESGAKLVHEPDGIVALVISVPGDGGRLVLVKDNIVCDTRYIRYFRDKDSYHKLGSDILNEMEIKPRDNQ